MRRRLTATPFPERLLRRVRHDPGAGLFLLLFAGGGRISRVVGRSVSGTAGAEDVTGGLTSVTISGMGRVVGRGTSAGAEGPTVGAVVGTDSPAATWACNAWINAYNSA